MSVEKAADVARLLVKRKKEITVEEVVDAFTSAVRKKGAMTNERAAEMFLNAFIRARLRKVRQVTRTSITVDYRKSVCDVCLDFTEFVLGSGSLDILCRPWAPYDPSLPSWVPSWSVRSVANMKLRAHSFVGSPTTEGHPYQASLGKRAHWTIQREERSLLVQGVVVAEIAMTLVGTDDGIIPGSWPQRLNWKTPKEQPPDQFWRLLVADRDSSGQTPPVYWRKVCQRTFESTFEWTESTFHDLNPSQVLAKNDTNGTMAPSSKDFLMRMRRVVASRSLVLLEDGSAGLAPTGAKKGDIVCVLYGCSVPVVLRRNGGRYRLVGESYISGIMCGEALLHHDLKATMFEIW